MCDSNFEISNTPPRSTREAAQCWRRGTLVMNDQNWDKSIARFRRAALLVPDNVLYRQSLRGCEFKKFGDDRARAVLSLSDLSRLVARIADARLDGDWGEMDRIAEEGLCSDPWSRVLNLAMAEACEKRGFLDCATFGRAIANC